MLNRLAENIAEVIQARTTALRTCTEDPEAAQAVGPLGDTVYDVEFVEATLAHMRTQRISSADLPQAAV